MDHFQNSYRHSYDAYRHQKKIWRRYDSKCGCGIGLYKTVGLYNGPVRNCTSYNLSAICWLLCYSVRHAPIFWLSPQKQVTISGHATHALTNSPSQNRYVHSLAFRKFMKPRRADLFCAEMTSRTKLKRKEVDDVLGGEEMWKHADSTAGK